MTGWQYFQPVQYWVKNPFEKLQQIFKINGQKVTAFKTTTDNQENYFSPTLATYNYFKTNKIKFEKEINPDFYISKLLELRMQTSLHLSTMRIFKKKRIFNNRLELEQVTHVFPSLSLDKSLIIDSQDVFRAEQIIHPANMAPEPVLFRTANDYESVLTYGYPFKVVKEGKNTIEFKANATGESRNFSFPTLKFNLNTYKISVNGVELTHQEVLSPTAVLYSNDQIRIVFIYNSEDLTKLSRIFIENQDYLLEILSAKPVIEVVR